MKLTSLSKLDTLSVYKGFKMAYESGWTPIVEFQTGETVNNKLTNAFGSIDTNLSDIDTRLTNLEQHSLGVYEFGKAENMIITSDLFQPVTSVTVLDQPVGLYEYKVSLRFRYNNTSTSAVFRYALVRNDNPTPTWYEVWHEVKDTTNDDIIAFGFPLDEAGGDKVEFKLEARCEATGHQLDIEYADMIIDQKR